MASVDEAAEKNLRLLQNPEEARGLAELGQQHVKDHFLITRLIAD